MRNDYISWDEYFMNIAVLSALRSKDENTQVGACIVNNKNRIVSIGYNGMPNGCNDIEMPWGRDGAPLHTKYPFVCHAELNAILNTKTDLEGCTLYVTLFPCNECAKAIIQSGIKKVVFYQNKYKDTDSCRASTIMFDKSNVKVAEYNGRILY